METYDEEMALAVANLALLAVGVGVAGTTLAAMIGATDALVARMHASAREHQALSTVQLSSLVNGLVDMRATRLAAVDAEVRSMADAPLPGAPVVT